MPTKPTAPIVSSTGDQRSNRFPDTFFDRHVRRPRFPNGRPWSGWREHPANQGHAAGFVGPISPGEYHENDIDAVTRSVWDAPFMPEVRFAEFDFPRKLIKWRYDRMFAEDMAAHDRYYNAAAIVAQQIRSEAPKYGSMPEFGIVALIGKPPRSPKIAEALIAGDPWLLGMIDEPNVALAELLGMNESQARAAMRKNVERMNRAANTPVVDDEAPVKEALTVEAVLAASAPMLAQMVAAAMTQIMAAQEADKKEKDRKRTEKARDTLASRKKAAAEPVAVE